MIVSEKRRKKINCFKPCRVPSNRQIFQGVKPSSPRSENFYGEDSDNAYMRNSNRLEQAAVAVSFASRYAEEQSRPKDEPKEPPKNESTPETRPES